MVKMGRPTIPAKDRASRVVALRLTPAEEKALKQLAKDADLAVGDYVRMKLKLRGDK